MLLALVFPGDSLPQTLSRWAPLHWVLGIASYGLFGAAVLHAAMMRRAEKQMRRPRRPTLAEADAAPMGLPQLRLERLTFRFVGAGFVMLSAAIALSTTANLTCAPQSTSWCNGELKARPSSGRRGAGVMCWRPCWRAFMPIETFLSGTSITFSAEVL